MIIFRASIRQAKATSDDAITTSSVGIPVQLNLAPEFNGLAKTVVFRAGDVSVDIALVGDATETEVPVDVLTTPGVYLAIGVYAADGNGTIVIPTVWANAGTIARGAVPSGVDPAEPTPNWVAQVQAIAAQASEDAETALEKATAVETAAEEGEFDGADGYSPTVSVTDITGGHRVSITDVDGSHVFEVMDGTDGTDGEDGFSPTVTVAEITGGHRVTITDANGAKVFDVMDGKDGADGADGADGKDGADGFSPTITVTDITGGHRVSVTDANGTQTFDVMDGEDGADGADGADGQDGVSPEVTIASITGGHSVTITDADHPGGQAFNVMDGDDGVNGADGELTAAVLATKETSNTASKAYSVGDYLYYNSKLYRVTVDIASGGTITPNTNCVEAKLADDVSDVKSAISNFTEEIISINKFDGVAVTGHYIANTGVVYESESYWYTENYIPVKPGDVVKFWKNSSGLAVTDECRFIAAYKSDKTVDSSAGTTTNVSSYTVPSNIYFIRLTKSVNVSPENYMITINETPTYFIPYEAPHLAGVDSFFDILKANYPMRKRIDIVVNDGIESFYETMIEAYETGDCDVYIGKGTYTYTNAFVESVRAKDKYKKGVPIGGNNRYFFETGALLYCEYTGDNTSDVNAEFNMLNSENVAGSWELHNLNAVGKNICYIVHDEVAGASQYYKRVYKNCHMELDNTDVGSGGNIYSKCIGGGLGENAEIIIEDCTFKTINLNPSASEDASYHGATGSTHTLVHAVITGCYFSLKFRMSKNPGDVAPWSKVIYTNNSSAAAVVLPDTWDSYVWNNVVRT